MSGHTCVTAHFLLEVLAFVSCGGRTDVQRISKGGDCVLLKESNSVGKLHQTAERVADIRSNKETSYYLPEVSASGSCGGRTDGRVADFRSNKESSYYLPEVSASVSCGGRTDV